MGVRSGKARLAVRGGFLLQGSGLLAFFAGGALATWGSSSLAGYLIGAVLVIASVALALPGAILLRKNYASIGLSGRRGIDYLVPGTILLCSGTGPSIAFNISSYYLTSQAPKTAYADAGTAISGCGCVIAAYSIFVVRPDRLLSRNRPQLKLDARDSRSINAL